MIVLVALLEIGLGEWLEYFWVTLFPFFAQPAGYDATTLFIPEMQKQWIGQWSLLGLFATLALFNTFLGEEFLFRGVLLPRMNGSFGKWDWAARQPDLCLERKELPQQLAPYHFAFRAKHLLFISDSGSCTWVGIDWRNVGGLPRVRFALSPQKKLKTILLVLNDRPPCQYIYVH